MFSPWVRKIPWRRKWQPIPAFLPGKSHGQRRLAGYSVKGHKKTGLSDWGHTHRDLKIRKWSQHIETAETKVEDNEMCSESSVKVPEPFPVPPRFVSHKGRVAYTCCSWFLSFAFLRDFTSLPTAHSYWCPPWTLDVCVRMISSNVPKHLNC